MTDTDQPVSDEEAAAIVMGTAPWPIPEGSTLDDAARHHLDEVVALIDDWSQDWGRFFKDRPVKRDPHYPAYVHDLAEIIDKTDWAIDVLKGILDDASEALARAVPFGTSHVTFPDCRPLTPRWGGERKEWRNDLLMDDVRPRILFDPETGEKRDGEEVLEATLSVVSMIGSNVKTGGLKKMGLDPDDYCHKAPKPPTVQVVK